VDGKPFDGVVRTNAAPRRIEAHGGNDGDIRPGAPGLAWRLVLEEDDPAGSRNRPIDGRIAG
jgi:hypothetical protein